MSKITHKAINFDLDINALKEYYPKDFHKAYYDIKAFMIKNGFKHRQGSGYISDHPITKKVAIAIIENLDTQMPWFSKCVKTIDMTEIGKVFDMKTFLNDNSDGFEQKVILEGKDIKDSLSQIRSALDESDRQADIFKNFGFNDEAKASQTKIQRRL